MKEEAKQSLREWLLGYFVSPIGDGAIGDAEFLALATEELAKLRNWPAVRNARRDASMSKHQRSRGGTYVGKARRHSSPVVHASE